MIFTSYPKLSFKKIKKILEKFSSILESGNYINSNEVKKFEFDFSKYVGLRYAASVGNATDALYLSLKALDVKAGENVITVSHTATATITAIMRTGANPNLIDIDESDYNMDLSSIDKKINSKTKAIIVVHLYGQSCNMQKLVTISKKYNIPIIEDCSQSAGSFLEIKDLIFWIIILF